MSPELTVVSLIGGVAVIPVTQRLAYRSPLPIHGGSRKLPIHCSRQDTGRTPIAAMTEPNRRHYADTLCCQSTAPRGDFPFVYAPRCWRRRRRRRTRN